MEYIDMTQEPPTVTVDDTDAMKLQEMNDEIMEWVEWHEEVLEMIETQASDMACTDMMQHDSEYVEELLDDMEGLERELLDTIRHEITLKLLRDDEEYRMDMESMKRQGMAQDDTYMIEMMRNVLEYRDMGDTAWRSYQRAQDELECDDHDRNTLIMLEMAQDDMSWAENNEMYWTIMLGAEMDRKVTR